VVFDVGGYLGEWAYTIGVLECSVNIRVCK
jgi:hypothetical protein